MNELKKVAIIGAGTIANGHANALKTLKDKFQVIAVCDINEDAAKNLGDMFGAQHYTDYHMLLEKENTDICLICLPHSLHLPVGLDVLNSGKHLFLEKPMALTTDECRQLIEIAEKNSQTIMVGHTHQYYKNMLKAKEFITVGKIGEPQIIFDEIIVYYNWESRKPWFLDPKVAGGGALLNTLPHQVDHLLFLIDSPITAIRANVSSLRKDISTIDSDSFAFVEYENGVRGFIGVFSGTKLEEKSRLNCKVLGTEGSVQFNVFNPELEYAKLDTREILPCPSDHHPFVDEWKEFADALDENRQPITDGVYGHNVVAVINAMVESSKIGKEIKPDLL